MKICCFSTFCCKMLVAILGEMCHSLSAIFDYYIDKPRPKNYIILAQPLICPGNKEARCLISLADIECSLSEPVSSWISSLIPVSSAGRVSISGDLLNRDDELSLTEKYWTRWWRWRRSSGSCIWLTATGRQSGCSRCWLFVSHTAVRAESSMLTAGAIATTTVRLISQISGVAAYWDFQMPRCVPVLFELAVNCE